MSTEAGFLALDITIKEKGAVPRRLWTVYTASSKESWHSTAMLFHTKMRDKRFSRMHGKEAGYAKRQGEDFAFGSKEWWQSYTGQKFKKFRHTNPLQFSGETRRNVHAASLSNPTSKGIRVAYPGARKLNFRNPHSDINMADEFRARTPRENIELAANYDKQLESKMNADQSTETRGV